MPRNDYLKVKDRVPRNGKGPENLLIQLGQYLRLPENKFTQKIVVDADRPYIYIEKMVPKDQATEEAGLTWHDAVRLVAMEEIAVDSWIGTNPTALELIDALFRTVVQNGYEVAQVLIGKRSELFGWLKLPRAAERLFGTPIQKVTEIPDDVVILCGSRTRECDPEDIEFSAKVTIP